MRLDERMKEGKNRGRHQNVEFNVTQQSEM